MWRSFSREFSHARRTCCAGQSQPSQGKAAAAAAAEARLCCWPTLNKTGTKSGGRVAALSVAHRRGGAAEEIFSFSGPIRSFATISALATSSSTPNRFDLDQLESLQFTRSHSSASLGASWRTRRARCRLINLHVWLTKDLASLSPREMRNEMSGYHHQGIARFLSRLSSRNLTARRLCATRRNNAAAVISLLRWRHSRRSITLIPAALARLLHLTRLSRATTSAVGCRLKGALKWAHCIKIISRERVR